MLLGNFMYYSTIDVSKRNNAHLHIHVQNSKAFGSASLLVKISFQSLSKLQDQLSGSQPHFLEPHATPVSTYCASLFQ